MAAELTFVKAHLIASQNTNMNDSNGDSKIGDPAMENPSPAVSSHSLATTTAVESSLAATGAAGVVEPRADYQASIDAGGKTAFFFVRHCVSERALLSWKTAPVKKRKG
jgi:hypothetical protein